MRRTTKVNSLNLILVPAEQVGVEHRVVLKDRQAEHVQRILRASVGDSLRVGIVDGKIGTGVIEDIRPGEVTLTVQCDEAPPAPLPIRLVLAMPRPRVARRVIAAVTSFGVKQIALVGSYRVEKSYWDSPMVTDDSLFDACVLGLEQARDSVLPSITKHRRFKPFVEDILPDFAAGTVRYIGHLRYAEACPAGVREPVTLAIGPEGGWTDYEIEQFQAAGFLPIHMGGRVLRVETAVSAILGRLCEL